jgi:hypothetical protein
MFTNRGAQRLTDHRPQWRTQQLEQVARGLAGGLTQERFGVAVEIDDFVRSVDDDCRRPVTSEERTLDGKRRRGTGRRDRRWLASGIPERTQREARQLREAVLARPGAPEDPPALADHFEGFRHRRRGFAGPQKKISPVV